MKIPPSRSRRGFTLVELLVVISIIAVLAAAGFAAGSAAIQKARKLTCQASATALETAVNNFYTEYNTLPTDGTSEEDIRTDSPAGVTLLKILLAKEDEGTATPKNSRGVKFLSVREGKKNKGGIIYDASSVPTGLYDPWGGPFYIRMDVSGDEQITVKTTSKNSQEKILNGRRVAVWSLGADYKSDNELNDDVMTWTP